MYNPIDGFIILSTETAVYNRIGSKIINPATFKQQLMKLHFLLLVLLGTSEADGDFSTKEQECFADIYM